MAKADLERLELVARVLDRDGLLGGDANAAVVRAAIAEIEALRVEVALLRKLCDYDEHHLDCVDSDNCTCGLDALRAALSNPEEQRG